MIWIRLCLMIASPRLLLWSGMFDFLLRRGGRFIIGMCFDLCFCTPVIKTRHSHQNSRVDTKIELSTKVIDSEGKIKPSFDFSWNSVHRFRTSEKHAFPRNVPSRGVDYRRCPQGARTRRSLQVMARTVWSVRPFGCWLLHRAARVSRARPDIIINVCILLSIS